VRNSDKGDSLVDIVAGLLEVYTVLKVSFGSFYDVKEENLPIFAEHILRLLGPKSRFLLDLEKNLEICTSTVSKLPLNNPSVAAERLFAHDLRNFVFLLQLCMAMLPEHLEKKDWKKVMEKIRKTDNAFSRIRLFCGIDIKNGRDLRDGFCEAFIQQDFTFTFGSGLLNCEELTLPWSLISRVLYNLVTNSIKAHPRMIHVIPILAGDNMLFVVADDGDGFLKDPIEEMFEKLKTSSGGIRLGLITCSQMVERAGGTLRGFSLGANRGATFILTVPNKPCTNPEGGHDEGEEEAVNKNTVNGEGNDADEEPTREISGNIEVKVLEVL